MVWYAADERAVTAVYLYDRETAQLLTVHDTSTLYCADYVVSRDVPW